MAALAVQYSLLTSICLLLLSALCAVISWRRASDATRLRKRVGALEMDIGTHESELSRLKDMVNRLSKRQALADYKAKVANGDEHLQQDMFRRDKPPGKDATKEQLRAFWLKGRTHQEIAQLARGGVSNAE